MARSGRRAQEMLRERPFSGFRLVAQHLAALASRRAGVPWWRAEATTFVGESSNCAACSWMSDILILDSARDEIQVGTTHLIRVQRMWGKLGQSWRDLGQNRGEIR